jgi:hypothetical protein
MIVAERNPSKSPRPNKDSPRSLIDGTLLDDYAVWLPTPEEIAASCSEIQAERERTGYVTPEHPRVESRPHKVALN